MADGVVRMRAGECRPVYGGVTAPTGSTVSVQGTPSYALHDAAGGIARSGAVNGYDAGSLTTARAWVLLDTAALAPGSYTLAFQISVQGSDGVTRLCEPVALVIVAAVG